MARATSQAQQCFLLTASKGESTLGIRCYYFQKMGRWEKYKSEVVHILVDVLTGEDANSFSFHICKEGIIEICILLYSQIIINIFSDGTLLWNIREGGRYMNIHRNEGVYRNNMVGYRTGYPEPIWFDPKGISNIIAMVLVEKHFPITYGKENLFWTQMWQKLTSFNKIRSQAILPGHGGNQQFRPQVYSQRQSHTGTNRKVINHMSSNRRPRWIGVKLRSAYIFHM